jgi:hypothetical protein
MNRQPRTLMFDPEFFFPPSALPANRRRRWWERLDRLHELVVVSACVVGLTVSFLAGWVSHAAMDRVLEARPDKKDVDSHDVPIHIVPLG